MSPELFQSLSLMFGGGVFIVALRVSHQLGMFQQRIIVVEKDVIEIKDDVRAFTGRRRVHSAVDDEFGHRRAADT